MARFYCGCRSSFVACVTYRPGRLTVQFKGNDAKYFYYFVPKKVFEDLRKADSVGSTYTETVKGKYPSKKVG